MISQSMVARAGVVQRGEWLLSNARKHFQSVLRLGLSVLAIHTLHHAEIVRGCKRRQGLLLRIESRRNVGTMAWTNKR